MSRSHFGARVKPNACSIQQRQFISRNYSQHQCTYDQPLLPPCCVAKQVIDKAESCIHSSNRHEVYFTARPSLITCLTMSKCIVCYWQIITTRNSRHFPWLPGQHSENAPLSFHTSGFPVLARVLLVVLGWQQSFLFRFFFWTRAYFVPRITECETQNLYFIVVVVLFCLYIYIYRESSLITSQRSLQLLIKSLFKGKRRGGGRVGVII